MFAVMNIMRMNNTLKIFAFSFNSEFYTLVYDEVMENKIKSPVTKYPNADGNYVWIILYERSIEK